MQETLHDLGNNAALRPARRLKHWTPLALAITIVLWSTAFVGIRAALPAYGPFSLALLRFLVASLVLGGIARVVHVRLPARTHLPRIIATGLIGITGYNLALNGGELSISAGAASLLVNTSPVWTALLARLFLKEQVRFWGWLGILTSFTGAALIALSEAPGLQVSWGAGLVVLAALQQGIYFVLQKPLLKHYRPIELASYAIWIGTLGLLPFAAGLLATISAAPISSTLTIIYLGVGPAALGYVTWSIVLSRMPSNRAASFLYLVPPTALLIAWVWLGELPGPLALAGGALAIGGVVLMTTRGRR